MTEKRAPVRRTTDLRANYVYEPWPADKLTQQMREQKPSGQDDGGRANQPHSPAQETTS